MVAWAGCLSMPLLRHHLAPFSAKLFAINSSRIPPQPKPPSGAKSGLSHFFEGFRFATIQCESLEDYLALPVVEDFKQVAHLIVQAFASEQREGRLSIFMTKNLPNFSRAVSQDY
jgi:hypothetical protein